MVKGSVLNGVNVIEEGNVIHFIPIPYDKKPDQDAKQPSFWERLKKWWGSLQVKPYVKIRDLADPFQNRSDPDAGQDGKQAAETGVKISF